MSPSVIIDLARQALQTAMLLALPVLGAALLIGLVVSTLQSLTQVHDQTIATVAKIVGVFVVLLLCMPWLIEILTSYSQHVVESIPRTISGRP